MFGWLRKKPDEKKTEEKPPTKVKPRRQRPAIIDQTGGIERGEVVQPGKLILKQQTRTQEGTESLYIQPVKLEIPNMVTIGGKLDMILDELGRKPDKEWFQADYIETLKNVLKLTNDAPSSEEKQSPEAEKIAKTIDMIQSEVAGALIIETLKMKGPLSITDLSKQTGVSRVTIWRDLKKLSKEGKVRVKREGKFKVACIK